MSRSFNHPHYGFVCGRHDAAWQPRARNPQDWDLGWLEAIGWTQESLAFLTQQFNRSTCAARCARALSCWNTKSLPDSLRITGSNMTSLWRSGAALKKTVRHITSISCFVTTIKLLHALQIYSTFLRRSVCGCIFQGSAATNYKWSGKFNYVFVGR